MIDYEIEEEERAKPTTSSPAKDFSAPIGRETTKPSLRSKPSTIAPPKGKANAPFIRAGPIPKQRPMANEDSPESPKRPKREKTEESWNA
ncbi:hypothetical protein BDN71DRAFT_1459139 [Pleurotus eryngii]|uniref:Uncharacterized protein n=1 Tax=Pleurotus eryngii TaxID=5323 RepID=A0A9P6D7N9_PLEER|nr:hypothetical protein BDN71DRAFT_1459139 [Pleurotus eryngii]